MNGPQSAIVETQYESKGEPREVRPTGSQYGHHLMKGVRTCGERTVITSLQLSTSFITGTNLFLYSVELGSLYVEQYVNIIMIYSSYNICFKKGFPPWLAQISYNL